MVAIFRVLYLESGWAPVDKLDGPLGLDGGDGGVDVFGDDVSSVEEATRHVFTVTGIAFHLRQREKGRRGKGGGGGKMVKQL